MAKPTSLQPTWWRTTRQMRLGSFLVVNIKTVMNNVFCNALCSNNYKLVKVRAKTKAMPHRQTLVFMFQHCEGGSLPDSVIKFSSSKTVAANQLRIFNAQWQYVLLHSKAKHDIHDQCSALTNLHAEETADTITMDSPGGRLSHLVRLYCINPWSSVMAVAVT